MFRRYAAAEPEAISTALSKCLEAIEAKGNAQAEVLTTRLLCQVLNGEIYASGEAETKAPEESVGFWRAALAWSRDHKQAEGLAGFAAGSGNSQTDLARVLLARARLDEGDTAGAAGYLAKVGAESEQSVLAGKERGRLEACRQRDAKLAAAACKEAQALVDVAGRSGTWPAAVEAYLLLAEFSGDRDSGVKALSEAVRCCEAGGVTAGYGGQIEQRLAALQAEAGASSEALSGLKRRLGALPAAGEPAAAPGAALEGAAAEAYGMAMFNLGVAMRSAGRFERAIACFRLGFERAPFAATAPRCLQEEAWTLRFQMGQLPEADEVYGQVVAMYPTTKQGLTARTRLRVHYEGTKGKHPE